MDNSSPLAHELSALAGLMEKGLITEESAGKAAQSLAYVLRDSVPSTVGAGASIINARGRRESAGATDPVVLRADKLQYELGEGPCLSAWAEQRTVIIQDTHQETQWPQWIAKVSNLPIRSVLSAPLTTEGRRIGALKVYSPLPLAFDDSSVFLIERLAGPAAVLLGNVRDRQTTQRLSAQLSHALGHRDLVSKAQGVLIGRLSISEDEALSTMISASRSQHKALHVIAQDIVSGMTDF